MRFRAEYERLSGTNRALFMLAVRQLVEDFRAGRKPRPSLRVKRVQDFPGVWELSWAADGRATFEYGPERTEGQSHIIWRRIGSHEIFRNP